MEIGKATSLKKRISQYIKFGHGANVGHYGGRFIWQLADSKDLIVCWKPSLINPRTEESALIQEFIGYYGERPFANLQDQSMKSKKDTREKRKWTIEDVAKVIFLVSIIGAIFLAIFSDDDNDSCKPSIMITHAPGHMFITDVKDHTYSVI